MRAEHLILRCYAEYHSGQWQAFCLDFCLAAQADSFEQARKKLYAMIEEYLADALEGEDQPYAAQLLSRKAPLAYWLKYYAYLVLARLGISGEGFRKLFDSTLPMKLAKPH